MIKRIIHSIPRTLTSSRTTVAVAVSDSSLSLRTFSSATSNSALNQIKNEGTSEMFCFQCEQTKHGVGCTTQGICGKTPETANLQDFLVENNKTVS
mmetsp:Transcript_102346/g.220940  ORF Transcript_102346/g.220940 Transcript_102346/m.220940 type:complete len:96 (+) Transcript_102346:16-303(+)